MSSTQESVLPKKSSSAMEAESLLQRPGKKPIEQEDWAQDYVQKMEKEVINVQVALDIKFAAEKEQQSMLAYMASFLKAPVIQLEYDREKQAIEDRKIILVKAYRDQSRQKEAEKIAREQYLKIPGSAQLSEKDTETNLRDLTLCEHFRIEEAEGVSAAYPDGLNYKSYKMKIYTNIYKNLPEIDQMFKKELQILFQEIEKIPQEIRGKMISEFKNLFSKKIILDVISEESEWESELKSVEKEIDEIKQKIDVGIMCSKRLEANESQKSETEKLTPADRIQSLLKEIEYVASHQDAWKQAAQARFQEIPDIDILTEPESKKILQILIDTEEKRQKYLDTLYTASVRRYWYGSGEFEEETPAITKIIEDKFKEIVNPEFEKILKKHEVFKKFNEGESGTAEEKKSESTLAALKNLFETELQNALIAKKKKERAGLDSGTESQSVQEIEQKISIAESFSKIPNFKKISVEQQSSKIQGILNSLNELKIIIDKQSRKESITLETASGFSYVTADQVEKKIQSIEENINAQVTDICSNLVLEEQEFSGTLQDKASNLFFDSMQNARNTIKHTLENPTVKSMIMGAFGGASLGSVIPGWGTSSGALIGAAMGWKNPWMGKGLDPLVYLISELGDIFKPQKGAYIDRGFRGATTLGAITGIFILGAFVTALVASGPIGWAVGLITAATWVTAILVGAAVAKGSKALSKKVSEARYGISNPDRYKLSAQARKLFSNPENKNEAEMVRGYFIKKITETQAALKAHQNEETPSKEANALTDQLFELEATWDKIQAGDETAFPALSTCTRHLFERDKIEYEKLMKEQIKENQKEIVAGLLNTIKPEIASETKSIAPTQSEQKIDIEPILFSPHGKGQKTEIILKEIHTLNEIHKLEKIHAMMKPKS